MREKILAQLVAKYPGVSKKFLGLWADKLAPKVTEETQIEGVVNELDNLPVSITDLATEFQKEGDTRVTEAEKTWKKKNPTTTTTRSKTDDTPTDDEPAPADDAPAWAKSLIESNKMLSQKLATIEKEKVQSTMKEKVAGHEKLKGKVPQSFLDILSIPEKEEELDTFADEALAKYQSVLKDSEVKNPLQRPIVSTGGGGNVNQPSESEIKELEKAFK